MELTQKPKKYRKEGLEYLTEDLIRNSEFFSRQLKIDFTPKNLELTPDDLNCLPIDRLNLIERLYGLRLNDYPTLKKVGDEVNITIERVRQKIAESSQELYRIILKREWESEYGSNNPDLPIELTELSTRIKGALLEKNAYKKSIDTVREITNYSRRYLLKLNNFGTKSLKEVEQYLSKHNLTLED